MNLTAHFTLKELTASQTAKRYNLQEQLDPLPEVIANLMYLSAKLLEPIRSRFGAFSPTSVYRCPALNHLVRGSVNSFHLLGCAADIDFGSVKENRILFNFIKEYLDFTELIDEYNGDWIHVAIVKGRQTEKRVKYII